VVCNSLDLVLPIELWCNPLDNLVDVNSGVQVLSSVLSGAGVVEWARRAMPVGLFSEEEVSSFSINLLNPVSTVFN